MWGSYQPSVVATTCVVASHPRHRSLKSRFQNYSRLGANTKKPHALRDAKQLKQHISVGRIVLYFIYSGNNAFLLTDTGWGGPEQYAKHAFLFIYSGNNAFLLTELYYMCWWCTKHAELSRALCRTEQGLLHSSTPGGTTSSLTTVDTYKRDPKP